MPTKTSCRAVHEHLPPKHEPFFDLLPPQGIRLTPRHYAYLKISEGCNNKCSFCIIPSMRGRLASRPIDEVMREAERLVQAGVKELLVISQDTSAYGADIKYRAGFLARRRLRVTIHRSRASLGTLGVWVRMHYVYPYPHVDQVIPLMAEGRVLPYLDIPFQHGSTERAQENASTGACGEHPGANPKMARRVPGSDNSQHVHRGLSRRDRSRIRRTARLAR